MLGISGVKRSLPTELRQELDEIKGKVSKLTESLCDLEDNNKRWLLVGIGLHTIISPALRKHVAPRLDQLWQTLKKNYSIDSQLYPKHLKSYLSTFLNYEAINNNTVHGLRQQSKFDYKVKDSVDLSKLFLQTNMAQYTGFDESCDSSALLGIVTKTGVFPANALQYAEKIRSEIRNRWAHCNFTEWSDTKYKESSDLMEKFVRSLSLSTEEENKITAQLETWSQNGIMHVMGLISYICLLRKSFYVWCALKMHVKSRETCV